jgi:hypothetical protein
MGVSETSEGKDEISYLGDCIREMQFYIYRWPRRAGHVAIMDKRNAHTNLADKPATCESKKKTGRHK